MKQKQKIHLNSERIMKRIKLFEEFNNKYYQKISYDEFQDVKRKIGSQYHMPRLEFDDNTTDEYLETDDITREEIEKIMKFFPNCEYESPGIKFSKPVIKLQPEKLRIAAFPGNNSCNKGELFIFHDHYICLDLTKIVDEWYYIEFLFDEFTSYKCDQFEGLIQLLKDKEQEIKKHLSKPNLLNRKN